MGSEVQRRHWTVWGQQLPHAVNYWDSICDLLRLTCQWDIHMPHSWWLLYDMHFKVLFWNLWVLWISIIWRILLASYSLAFPSGKFSFSEIADSHLTQHLKQELRRLWEDSSMGTSGGLGLSPSHSGQWALKMDNCAQNAWTWREINGSWYLSWKIR